MKVVYAAPDVTVYDGDVLNDKIADVPDLRDVQVVLTDPPYAANKYLRELEAGTALQFHDDNCWTGNIFFWVGLWFPPLRLSLPPKAVGWFFCNVHYVGFYLRWAHLLHWPLRGVFGFGTGEFLLAFGTEPLHARDMGLIDVVLTENKYGQGKSVRMLRALLQASPAGPVFDPFCGSGSTLVAARAEGRVSLGLDCDPKALQRTRAALEACPPA